MWSQTNDWLRELRNRDDRLDADIDRAPRPFSDGSAAVLAKTTTVGTYPTSAGAVYGMTPQYITVNDVEAAVATYAADGRPLFYALNLGGAIPPTGTVVLCISNNDGQWVFSFG